MSTVPGQGPAQRENESLRLPAPQLTEASFSSGGRELIILTDNALVRACGTRIAFTQRYGGKSTGPFSSLNLSLDVGDDVAAVQENRSRLLAALAPGKDTVQTVNPQQVHGDRILVYAPDAPAPSGHVREKADGIVCGRDDMAALLCFADCVPVISVAPSGEFAVTHAGWRGAIADIAGKGLEELCALAHCEPYYCNTYIGPHIGACCYEVDEALLERFVVEYGRACRASFRHLDLSAAVVASLVAAGADPQRIADAHACTACHVDTYYSYRAQDGVCGRHGAFAMKVGRS